MKYWVKALALCVSFSVLAMTSYASSEKKEYKVVKQNIENILRFEVLSIGDAPVPGLVQVSTNRGFFYTSEDGQFLISGKIFNVAEGMRDETEKSLAKLRLNGIVDFNQSVIEFKAPNEQFVVNVFTDISCGYCRKLHREIEEYNANGITVRYLAFPRGGLTSKSYKDMVSVWCSKDQHDAMTVAKTSGKVTQTSCENSVAQQYNFGQQVGVTGTPNIILPDGSMVPGYQPAHALLNTLKNI